MSRPLRTDYPNAFHHVTARGNARRDVFLDDDERELYYEVFAEVVRDYNWICHADCQMTNHYHNFVQTPDANLSAGMRQLNGVLTQRLNRMRGTVGHILQGRFKSCLVDSERYLLEVCRYTVLNPVRAGMVRRPEEWRWSSYRATVGLDPPRAHLSTDGILLRFGERRGEAALAFERFVLSGIDSPSPFESAKGGVLGDEEFVRVAMGMAESSRELVNIAKKERLADRPSLESIFSGSGTGKKDRDRAMLCAWRDYGYTQKEISAMLGPHFTTVSRALKRLTESER
jgi:REP element-mobilizing transposase RayT